MKFEVKIILDFSDDYNTASVHPFHFYFTFLGGETRKKTQEKSNQKY